MSYCTQASYRQLRHSNRAEKNRIPRKRVCNARRGPCRFDALTDSHIAREPRVVPADTRPTHPSTHAPKAHPFASKAVCVPSAHDVTLLESRPRRQLVRGAHLISLSAVLARAARSRAIRRVFCAFLSLTSPTGHFPSAYYYDAVASRNKRPKRNVPRARRAQRAPPVRLRSRGRRI